MNENNTVRREYIAHRLSDDKRQSLIDHLLGTAELAKGFADDFGCGNIGELLGLYHDIGKCSKEWQDYIRDPENKRKIDHSTAGAFEISKSSYFLKTLFAYCIAGHHSGLLDYGNQDILGETGTLTSRLAKDRIASLPDYRHGFAELQIKTFADDAVLFRPDSFLPVIRTDGRKERLDGFAFYALTKMLFSSLVDADFLDTESFMDSERSGQRTRNGCDDLKRLYNKLQSHIQTEFADKEGSLNDTRGYILSSCMKGAVNQPGLYTLTVPTGGGKTIASVAFALQHALFHGRKRVIYVVPYTSIIEQTAGIFESIFGERNVLQHHSNYDFSAQDNENENEIEYKKKLASENWDMPIIVTTAVQFFESFFANRTSRCRKLHHIANSVIVFDEAQMLPLDYMKSCTQCIAELTYNYRCTALLCTATQPALGSFFPSEIRVNTLVKERPEWKSVFKRVVYENIGQCNNDEIAKIIREYNQALVIVNTKQHALDLFEKIRDLEGAVHLSAAMCGIHRSNVVKDIKNRLEDRKPCIVVATRLVEAGVDFDFPCVIKALAGLDSIVQAAGRCNREGKLDKPGTTYIFEPTENKYLPPMFRVEASAAKQIMKRYDDFTTESAIQDYFETLYSYKGPEAFDKHRIFEMIQQGVPESGTAEDLFHYDFRTIADQFKIIDETDTLIVPYDTTAEEMIEEANARGYVTKSMLRSLQKYTVNVLHGQFKQLVNSGAVQMVEDHTGILSDKSKYDEITGMELGTEQTGIAVFM